MDKDLFDHFRTLVKRLSDLDKVYNYTLVPNDITYIRYDKGGFFKAHSDFLSLKSNIIEEFTMIMCLDADPTIEGGGTIIHINDHFSYVSRASCTKDNVLVFRKDLTHEGELLRSGFKEIATANLWATLKEASALLVTFEGSTETYVIPLSKVEALGDTYISAMADFQTHNGSATGVLMHKAQCKPEEFRPIYDIFMGVYLRVEDYENAITQRLINEYCIDSKYILLSVPVPPIVPKHDVFTIHKPPRSPSPWTPDTSLYLCGRPEEAQRLIGIVKSMKLPMIPFKMVLVEGTRTFGGDAGSLTSPEKLDMCPLWFSAGELNNVFYVKNICNSGSATVTPFEDRAAFFNWKKGVDKTRKHQPTVLKDFSLAIYGGNEFADGTPIVHMTSNRYDSVSFDFEIIAPTITPQAIVDLIMDRNDNNDNELLGGGIKVQMVPKDVPYMPGLPWSLDAEGKMFLTARQGNLFKEFLLSGGFMENVMKALDDTTLRFTMPQRKQELDARFCNESVYGTMTLIYVEGLVQLALINDSSQWEYVSDEESEDSDEESED